MKKLAAFVAVSLLVTLLCAATALAAPPCPGEKKLVQPEGQEISATLKGDEWFHWYENGDGDVVVRGEDGWYRYAKYENGKLTALDAKAGVDGKPAGALNGKALEKAVQKQAPVASKAAKSMAAERRAGGITEPDGPEKLLIILISFNDVPLQQEDSYWNGKMFNDYSGTPEKTDAASSVNDYFKENSGGAFYFEPASENSGTANDGVIRVNYGGNHPAYTDSSFDNDSWAVATKALTEANASIDFSAYDTDNNKIITPDELHIVMVLAGGEQACSDPDPAVWAHSFGLSGSSLLTLDGVSVGGDYTQQGEYQGDHPATMGVLAHELGHSLGLPDLYDYGYESEGAGVYSLMASGNWEYMNGSNAGSSPTHLDAWSKYLLGFVVPETVYSGTHTINTVHTGSYNVLKLPTTDPNQYFLLENRQRAWGYDKPLSYACASGGIAVWHIDYTVLNAHSGWQKINDDETHKAVDLEEANEGILGYSQLDSNVNYWNVSGGYNHLYRTGSTGCNSSFTNATSPSSKLYDGNASGAGFSVSTAWADTMNVAIVGPSITSLTPSKASPQLQYRTVRWTCTAVGGINRTVKFDAVKNSVRTGGTDDYAAQAYFDWTPSEPGTYTITASVISEGVSTPVTQSATFTVTADTAAPVITVKAGSSAISDGACKNVNITATAADPSEGVVASKSYTLDGGAPVASWPSEFSAEGAYVLTATDQAGNAASFTFVIDKTAPAISAVCGSALTAGMTAPGDVTVTVTDDNPGTSAAQKDGAAVGWPAGGIFTETGVYGITATDLAGNVSAFRFGIKPYSDKLQVKDGNGAFLLDGDATTSNINVYLMDTSWTASVSLNGHANAWQDSGLHTFASEGVYDVTASDTSGHSVTMRFTVDLNAPAISARNAAGVTVAAGSIHTSAVTVTVTDISSVVKTATRGGSAYSWPADNKFTAEGSYALTVKDAVGRKSTLSFSIDLYAPLIVVNAGGTRIWNNGYAKANATVTVTDISAVTKSVKKNGTAISWPSGGVFSSDGVYAVTATDKYARKSTLTFTVDKTLPAVKGRQSTGAAAYSGGYYHHSVTITVTDKYLTSKAAKKNGKAMAWPSRGIFTGTGAYVITARDRAGNVRTFSFVVDKARPVITVKNLSGVKLRNYGTARGGATVTVSDGWLASKAVRRGTKAIAWPSTNKFTVKGTYTITAKDKAGNVTTFKFYVK